MIDSTLFPTVDDPVGQARLYTAEKTTTVPAGGGPVTTTDIEFDYSQHLDRIITALDRISYSLALLTGTADRAATSLETINSTRLADNLSTLATNVSAIKVLAETTGIKSMSPYDLITAASMYSYYTDNSADLDTLLTKIAAVPAAKLQAISDAVQALPKLP
jgi:hypothetical protein